MNRSVILTTVFFMLCIGAAAHGADSSSSDAREALKAKYLLIQKAWSNQDGSPYAGLCTPDAVFIQTNLDPQPLTSLKSPGKGMRAIGLTITANTFVIHRIILSKDSGKAEVDVEHDIDGALAGKQPKAKTNSALTRIKSTFDTHDYWLKLQNEWLLSKSVQSSDSMMRVGKRVMYVRNVGEPGYPTHSGSSGPNTRKQISTK